MGSSTLVAGDQFEDNHVAPRVVEQVAGLLNDRTRLPIYLIPGNHAPDTRDSVYRRSIWGQLREHVHVLREPNPVQLDERVILYPCPLKHRAGVADPTGWIPPRDGAELRIGLGHGTLPMIKEGMAEDAFPIALDRAEQAELDYLALGHWHSTMQYPSGSGRTWYSGAHETTKFGEHDSGNALLITLNGAGTPPHVQKIRTGELRWVDHQIDLDRHTLDEAMRALRDVDQPERTLLRITLQGQVRSEGGATLEDLLTLLAERYLHHQIDDSGLRPPNLDDAAIADLLGSPYLRKTAEYLEGIARGEPNGGTPPAVARRALQILHQVARRHHDTTGETAE